MSSDQHRASAHRASSGLVPLEQQIPHRQPPPHLRASQAVTKPERVMALAARSSSPNRHAQPTVPQHSSSQMVRSPGAAARLQAPIATPSAMNSGDPGQSLGEQRQHPVNDRSMEFPSEENWRRTVGRMRGSLTGQSYSAALSQLMVQPTIPAQPRPPIADPQVRVNPHGQTQVYTRAGDRGRTGG